MCESKDCCQKPELFKEASGKCTPEQIRICHGDGQGHPCTGKPQQTEQDDYAEKIMAGHYLSTLIQANAF